MAIDITSRPTSRICTSAKAVHSWMQMAGFVEIEGANCHRSVGRALAADRVAYIAQWPLEHVKAASCHHRGHDLSIGRVR